MRRTGHVVVGWMLVATAGWGVGCTRTVDGAGHPADFAAGVQQPIALSDLLIEPQRFPPDYPAVVLDPKSVEETIRHIDGIGPGAVVEPPQCAPPPPSAAPHDAVAARGVDATTSDSLVVVLTRAGDELAQRRDQLGDCASVTATAGELVTTVSAELVPSPPVDADDTLAVDQTVSEAQGATRRLLVLVAQIDDVRVTAAWIGAGESSSPDTEALHTLFSDAVLRVRRGVQ
ncbi:DUF5642 family protein [Mycobacterium hubeiense]|uniref:DUF5642 family protein n=1 Tax=Mycobacterium hubeiense TaxID=1867256 RepID=UPI00115A1569|nr:DUF5642 family protein [Mycobacterium sp. QGD 101]